MKKLLVILHVYYPVQVEYFISKLHNINSCEWDLLVTGPKLGEAVRSRFEQFKPGCRFLEVENEGYDVWPFIKAVKSEPDFLSYDYVMKLHTKNANLGKFVINGIPLRKYKWRSLLVNAMLKSPEQFRKCLNRFEKCPNTGMICSRELLKRTTGGISEDLSMLDNELERLGLKSKKRAFCAGTMFIARTAPLSFIQEREISHEMFKGVAVSHSHGTMAHVYERIFGISVSAAGYRLRGVGSDWPVCIYAVANKCLSPLLEQIFALKRFGEDSRKYLVILGIKIPLE